MIKKVNKATDKSNNKNKFAKIRVEYGTTNQALEFLNRFEGFEGIDRTTLFRWEKVQDERLPTRAILAINALRSALSKNKDIQLRIGEFRGLLGLPSSLTWLPQSETKPSVFKNLSGFDPEITLFSTGGEALLKLKKGEIDIAIAADLLVEEAERESNHGILNLGQLSMSPFYVVTSMTQIRSINDLQNAKIGYPSSSVIPQIIEKVSQETGKIFNKLIPCKTPEEAREGLLTGKIKALICWDWWVEEVIASKGHKVKREKVLYVFANIIGNHHINIAINKETINVQAFKYYLKALNYVYENINYLVKNNKSIFRHVGMKNNVVERYLSSMNYGLRNLNLNCILSIWDKEGATS